MKYLRVFEAQKHGKFYQKFYFVFPCPQTCTIAGNPCKASPYPGKRTLALESLLIASKRLAGMQPAVKPIPSQSPAKPDRE